MNVVRLAGRVGAWGEVLRVSNLPTVWTNVAAAWLLSRAGSAETEPAGLLLAGASCAYLAGMALNDAFDAKTDARERPGRPIPSGRLGVAAVWTAGAGLLVAGATMLVAAGAAAWVVAVLLAAIVFYNALHRRWAVTVALMAFCRVLLWWLPATLPGHGFSPQVIGWSGLVFVFIAGVSLLARGEAGERAPQSCVAMWLLPVPLAGVFLGREPFAPAPLVFAGLFGAALALIQMELRRGGPRMTARTVGRLLGAIPLIDALAVAAVSPAFAGLLAAASVLCWFLQRRIPAS